LYHFVFYDFGVRKKSSRVFIKRETSPVDSITQFTKLLTLKAKAKTQLFPFLALRI
jgi:hypothetical protein